MFAKHYSLTSKFRQDVANEFRGLQLTHAALRSNNRFRVPEPYRYDEDHRLLLMEYCPSINLGSSLFGQVRWSRFRKFPNHSIALHNAAQIGGLLAAFQGVPVNLVHARAAVHDLLIRYREHFLRNIEACKAVGLPKALLDAVVAHVSERLQIQEPVEIVAQHSDFGPWNILKGKTYLYLIDFHNFTVGLRTHDAAYFHAALDLWTRFRTVDDRTVNDAQTKFLNAFLRARGATNEVAFNWQRQAIDSLPLFREFRIAHMVYFAQIVLSRRRSAREVVYAPISRRRFFQLWFDRELS